MESVVIETLGCPLDPDLLKSWEQFSLESSYSQIPSDHSESDDGETEIMHKDLIEQLKNLSFDDVSDNKYSNSQCSNKITEINSQEKDKSGELIFVENTEIEENQSCSSRLKNQELLKFVVKADVESTFSRCLNKNCEINSKKKNNMGKLGFVENLENVENQLTSLSLKNNKSSNNYPKSSCDISAGDESDSNDDEQVESVTLRDRDPTRHNRPENNKHLRTAPFTRNHTKTSKPNLNSNISQTFGNFSSHILYDFNTSCEGYDSINHINSSDFESYGIVSPSSRTFHSGFTTSGLVIDEGFEGLVPSIEVDQIFNDVIPCTATNQIVNNGVIPCTVKDTIVDGAISYSVDQVLNSVVPSADDFGNASDKFSQEINEIPYFDNLKDRIVSNCAVTNEEKETFLDSCFENLTAEEVDNFLKYLTDATLDDISCQNHADLIGVSPLHLLSSKEVEKVLNNSSILNQNICVAPTIKENSYSKNSHHNFHPEPDTEHFSFSNANVGETSFYSNLNKKNNILEKAVQFCNSEYLVNDNYSNLVCKYITSINCESIPSETSDYRIISNEIDHEIVKWKEMKEWVKKGQKNVSEFPHEINWNVFPFDELDDNAISEYINTPEKMSCKKNESKRKNINQICKFPCRTEKTKICWMLGTVAKDKLFDSSSFCKIKWDHEYEEIRQQIENGKLGTKERKVIHFLKKNRKTKYKGTNLHYAILSENIEKVCCIVECHKECHDGISEINLRDSFNKTVLDYAKEKEMDLLTAYLEENTAKSCSYIRVPTGLK